MSADRIIPLPELVSVITIFMEKLRHFFRANPQFVERFLLEKAQAIKSLILLKMGGMLKHLILVLLQARL